MPSEAELLALLKSHKPKESTARQVWDKANEPLTDAPTRAADWLSDKINPDSSYTGLRGYSSAYIQGLGRAVSGLTSPLNVGITALTGGMGAARAAGAETVAPVAENLTRGLGIAQGGKGAYDMATAKKPEDVVTGAMEVSLGYAGARGARNKPLEDVPNAPGEPAPVAAKPTVEGVHTGSSPQTDTTQVDNLRRATLQEYRAYQANPESFEPKRAQALADNLVHSVGTPNAHAIAQDIYSKINDPKYVADVVAPGRGHATALAAEGEPEMSPYLKAELGTETPKREPGLAGQQGERLRGTGKETTDELGSSGRGFAPESSTMFAGAEEQPKGMFAKRTKAPKGKGKVKTAKPQAPAASVSNNDVEDISGPSAPVEAAQPSEVSADRPYVKASDNDVKFLAGTGDVHAQKELELRTQVPAKTGIGEVDSVPGTEPSATRPTEAAEGTEGLRPLSERLKGEGGFIDLSGKGKPAKPLEEGETLPKSGGWFGTLRDAESHSPGFADKFRTWVDSRKASKVEGILAKKKFAGLDAKGIQGIFDFQEGVRDGQYKDVQDYFDTKHQQVEQSGIRLGFKENYLPQLWNNSPDEVFEAARRLGLRPQFSLPSVLENYRKGIALGLKPKFQNISDLVGWYEQTANKAIADRQFFDHLNEAGLIRPKGKAPANGTWVTLDPDHFPIQKFKTPSKEFQGVLMAPKPVADTINNYLRPAQGKVLDTIANAMAVSKNYVMSSGIPGTGINAHGFNILARNIMANGAKGGAQMLKYMVSPSSAKAQLDAAMETAPFAMRHGLSMSVEDFQIGEANLKGALRDLGLKGRIADNKLLDFHTKYFEKPLFQEIIPALKLKHFNDFYAELRKQGLSETAAGRSAAEATNNLYGGVNWEAMGRSRDYQNLLRSVFLAPDWFETNYRIGKGMVQALKNPNTPQGIIYSRAAKNLLAAYVSANVVNMATSGHPMWDNAPGHTLDIQMGKSGDKNRYLRTFGTAADFARLPIDTLSAALKGDLGQGFKVVKNRLSMGVSATANLLTNTDDFGNKITGKDVYGKKIPVAKQALGIANEVTAPAIPQYIRNPGMYMTGRLNAEQAVAGTTESPLRYAYEPQAPGRTRRRLRSRVR